MNICIIRMCDPAAWRWRFGVTIKLRDDMLFYQMNCEQLKLDHIVLHTKLFSNNYIFIVRVYPF